MSDLLESASAALGTPAELVRRSAAARAAANGASVDDILSAWSGGAPAPATAQPPAETASPAPAEPAPEPEPETVSEQPAPAAVAVIEAAAPEPAPLVEPKPEVVLEPVPLRVRMRTAVRVGAWTGAALGVIGFLAASAFWAPRATALPESGPVVQVSPTSILIGIALVSVVFGAVVAGTSRAATAWTNPAMQLSGSKTATAWLGGGTGLVLGVVAGAMLNGLGTAVENSEPALIQLPILATLFVIVIGGAVLGAVTAVIPQVIGVPVAVDEAEAEEVKTLKGRLANAVGIPLAGLLLLVTLVLPFAYALIQTNHMAPGVGGAVVAVIAAGGILGFAALAGTKPEMRISLGDVMVAIVGIGLVLALIIAVLFANRDEEHAEEPVEGGSPVAAQLL